MENENQAEQELLRLRSVEFWRGRVQELTLENSELLQEIKRLRDQRDFFAFEAIANQIDNTDWSEE